MEYNEKLDLFISQMNLPSHIKAFITSKNGHVFVTVNENLTDEAKRIAIIHEIMHYRNDDIVSEMPVFLIEKRNV